MRTTTPLGTIALTVAASLAPSVAAAPPTDAEVYSRVRTAQTRYAELEQRDFGRAKRAMRDLTAAAFEGLDLSALTPDQAVLVAPLLQHCLERERVLDLVESFQRAADDPRRGAAALLMLHKYTYGRDPTHAYLRRFLEHPALDETMDTEFGAKALNSFGLDPELMRQLIDDVERAVLAIHPDAFSTAPSRAAVARFFDALDHPDVADEARPQRERIHEHLLKVARSTVARFAPAGGRSYEPEKMQIRSAVELVQYLEGPGASAGLVGQPAPELDFRWIRGPDAPFDSLDDLRGKVVVLDFWATWCGPCVASFPETRELQARFEGRGVAIIGATSIQGAHVADGETTELEGQPEREIALMAEYMQDKDITWNVAFSTRNAIDARYDVRGIPHVTIIDPEGIVRSNGLHPSGDAHRIEEIVESILAESPGG